MARTTFQIADALAALCVYAEAQLGLTQLDRIYAENNLLDLFHLSEPGTPPDAVPALQPLLDAITAYAVKQKLCKAEEALLFETKLMGYVTPAPSVVVSLFDNLAGSAGVEDATNYLNDLSVRSNYIRTVDIEKNIRWSAPGDMGELTITINLSKPEKDNKQVLLEKSLPQTSYPKCALCLENVGFAGNLRRAARQTLRTIPIYLNDEAWHFQFSPYVYYDHHAIAFSGEHRPMKISPATFTRLLDFTELFPHYFIGSNADLPIVGGSILSHDHFQGGKKVLPMLKRGARQSFVHRAYPEVDVCVLDWYNSVIRLQSTCKDSVEKLGATILSAWQNYSDESVEIYASTKGEPHNTVTPVATLEGDRYTLYFILRNNRTDEKRPFGIYHPTEDMHNIKKEGIGLIEAMGIFILPGRLFQETKEIVSILSAGTPPDFKTLMADEKMLPHLAMIAQLANDHGTSLSPEQAESAVVNAINETCIRILHCTAVFKNTNEGQAAFARFLSSCGIIVA